MAVSTDGSFKLPDCSAINDIKVKAADPNSSYVRLLSGSL
jgi:hypothetical protein